MWHERTSPLDPSSPNRFWEKQNRERKKERERKEDIFRERGSNFSLNFSAIGPSVSGETKAKLLPHGKGYAWVPVLWSFDNSGM